MPQIEPTVAWMDGGLVPWDRCVLHGRTQAAVWGSNVFEGIRGYWCPAARRLNLFRLDDHLRRLRQSMRAVRMVVPYSDAELAGACVELCRANRFQHDVHLVIVAYFGMGVGGDTLGLTDETGVYITGIARPRSPGFEDGITVAISSWRRIGDDTMPPRIKTGANYHNSRLAHQEAVRHGYGTALILNQRGTVAESPSANLAMVRDGEFVTPPGTSGALEGITLATVAGLAQDEVDLTFCRREIDRTELYIADEVLLCGTLAEVLPVVSIDGVLVGSGVPGPVTRRLQALYEGMVRTEGEAGPWITPVGMPEPEPACEERVCDLDRSQADAPGTGWARVIAQLERRP
jgi:branched-chain amino acid aminotransferase